MAVLPFTLNTSFAEKAYSDPVRLLTVDSLSYIRDETMSCSDAPLVVPLEWWNLVAGTSAREQDVNRFEFNVFHFKSFAYFGQKGL
jgi:hypothetical protein